MCRKSTYLAFENSFLWCYTVLLLCIVFVLSEKDLLGIKKINRNVYFPV